MPEIYIKALLAGVVLALLSAVLGCVVQWRRLAFFSDSLSHSALLGIGIALVLHLNIIIGLAMVVLLLIVLLHGGLEKKLPSDSLLAIFAHVSLAAGVVLIASTDSNVNWEHLLFGNILELTNRHLAILTVTTVIIGIAMHLMWSALVALAINEEVAEVEVPRAKFISVAFSLLLCLYVAVGVSLVGVLMLNALLILPAAIARNLVSTPLQMLGVAIVIGIFCLVAGVGSTIAWEIPAGPACVLIAGVIFAGVWAVSVIKKRSQA